MIKQKILADLKQILEDFNFPTTDIVCTISKNPKFGDYSTNIALQLAKLETQKGKQSSTEIANKISEKFGKPEYLDKVEVAANGFINFFIKPEILAKDLTEVLEKGGDFGKSDLGSGRSARIEFISANPTGPLHIGNARSGPLGDVVANILSFCGFKVLREFIDNDVGEQIKALGQTIKAKYHGNSSDVGSSPKDVGSSPKDENQYQGEYINELVKELQEDIEGKSDEEIGQLAVKLMHEEILSDAHSMGIKFDLIVHESDLRKQAPQIIEELKKSNVVKEKDGALWLAPNDEFLKDRETVIQKSDGGYTYFTADIVYHKMKFESDADPIIDIFGSNHHGHVPRLQAAMSALGFDPKRLKVILYQYVRVKRGNEVVKMSKRAGDFITAREVLDEVGLDAVRFYLLRFAPQTHMDFDLELVKQQSSNNPVFYVQYAHARMSNILLKAEEEDAEPDLSLLINPKEIALIKHLMLLPDLISEVAENLAAHQLTEYVITLADYFHKFYEACPVLSAETKELISSRLALVKAARITLANTLKLLGVSAPERM